MACQVQHPTLLNGKKITFLGISTTYTEPSAYMRLCKSDMLSPPYTFAQQKEKSGQLCVAMSARLSVDVFVRLTYWTGS